MCWERNQDCSRITVDDLPGRMTMRRPIRILLIILLFPPTLAAVGGWLAGPSFLHPIRRELSPDLIREADVTFEQIGVHREAFDVRAPDAVLLRGWKVRAARPNGNWVLVYHGVADNRMGVLEHARILLLAGYSVVMMDSRAHGASEGPMATYGWLERNDARAIVDALETSEHPRHLFALGESMGAGIALQSGAIEPRTAGLWYAKWKVDDIEGGTLMRVGTARTTNPRHHWLARTLYN